jgi:hypothetical protein
MIDAFNGPVFLILFIINFLGGAYYAYQALFNTEKFCDQYGIHHSAILPFRLAGSLIAALVLVSIYILFRENGPQGTWPIFVFGFLQSLIFTYFGYVTVKFSEAAKLDGVKYTAEAYIAPAGFTILNAILIYGLSDKLYT